MIQIIALAIILIGFPSALFWLMIRVITKTRLIQYKSIDLEIQHCTYAIQVKRRGLPLWLTVRSNLEEEDAMKLYKYYKGLIEQPFFIVETSE